MIEFVDSIEKERYAFFLDDFEVVEIKCTKRSSYGSYGFEWAVLLVDGREIKLSHPLDLFGRPSYRRSITAEPWGKRRPMLERRTVVYQDNRPRLVLEIDYRDAAYPDRTIAVAGLVLDDDKVVRDDPYRLSVVIGPNGCVLCPGYISGRIKTAVNIPPWLREYFKR